LVLAWWSDQSMQGIQEETVRRAEVVIVSSSPVPALSVSVKMCLPEVPPFLHKHLHQ